MCQHPVTGQSEMATTTDPVKHLFDPDTIIVQLPEYIYNVVILFESNHGYNSEPLFEPSKDIIGISAFLYSLIE